jgi:hypothetical protein
MLTLHRQKENRSNYFERSLCDTPQMKEHSIENWKKVLDGLKKVVEEKSMSYT